jgi:TolA-binding protein
LRNLFNIIIITGLGVGAFTANAASVEAVNRSRQLGTMAFDKADYKHAVYLFKRYLAEAGDDKTTLADAYECLIAAYIRNGDIKAAGETLGDFNKNLPGISLMRKKLFQADILLLEKKYSQAAELYDSVLSTSIVTGELYFQLLSGLAFAQGKQEKWSRAVETYVMLEKASKDSSWQLQSRQMRIEALIMDGQLDSAENLLKKLAAQANDFRTKRLNLLLLIKQKKYSEFLKNYQAFIKKDKLVPNGPMYNLCTMAIKYFLIANDTAGAIILLNDAWYFAPTEYDRKKTMRSLINTYVRADNKVKAIKIAEKYIKFYKAITGAVEVRFQLARLFYEIKKSTDAELVYKNLMSDNKVPLKSRLVAAEELAALFANDKRYDLAEQTLDFIYKNGANDADKYKGRFMTGKLYMQQAKYAKAAIIFSDIAQHSPAWHDQAIFQQIKSLSALKEDQQALNLVEKSLPTIKDSIILKNVAYQQAVILERLGQLKAARTSYLDFVSKYPGNEHAPTALFAAANIAYNGQKFAMAAELFAEFIHKYSQNQRAANAMYKRLYANYLGGQPKIALQDADLMLKNYPKSKYTLDAIFWKVDWLRENHKYSMATKLLNLIQEKYKDDKKTMAQALYELALIDYITDKFAQSFIKLKIIFDKYSSSPITSDANLLAGDALSNSGKYQQAIKYYLRGIELRPKSQLEITCQGRIGDCNFVLFNKTADKKYLDNAIKAYKALLKLEDISPAIWGQTKFKLGRSYEAQGLTEQALNCYTEVILGYELDRKTVPGLHSIWAVKAIYAEIVIYLKKGTPEAARRAINLYKQLQAMDVKTGEDFPRLIMEIEQKYNL